MERKFGEEFSGPFTIHDFTIKSQLDLNDGKRETSNTGKLLIAETTLHT